MSLTSANAVERALPNSTSSTKKTEQQTSTWNGRTIALTVLGTGALLAAALWIGYSKGSSLGTEEIKKLTEGFTFQVAQNDHKIAELSLERNQIKQSLHDVLQMGIDLRSPDEIQKSFSGTPPDSPLKFTRNFFTDLIAQDQAFLNSTTPSNETLERASYQQKALERLEVLTSNILQDYPGGYGSKNDDECTRIQTRLFSYHLFAPYISSLGQSAAQSCNYADPLQSSQAPINPILPSDHLLNDFTASALLAKNIAPTLLSEKMANLLSSPSMRELAPLVAREQKLMETLSKMDKRGEISSNNWEILHQTLGYSQEKVKQLLPSLNPHDYINTLCTLPTDEIHTKLAIAPKICQAFFNATKDQNQILKTDCGYRNGFGGLPQIWTNVGKDYYSL